LGKTGEHIASDFLQKQGYRILERNYKTRIGEIDIIARDRKTLCFVEVKARRSLIFGDPAEAVTKEKQIKLSHMAQVYLKHKQIPHPLARFDVVSIVMGRQQDHNISLIKNAFEVSI